MIDGLAKQLHGTFTLTSEIGRGTTATLWLPASEEAISPPGPSSEIEPDAPACPLKIVAVDDDFLILMNTADLLADLGHEVLDVNSGEAALDLIRQHPDVDLLITDQTMPNMTGTQLVQQAVQDRPDLAIVLATGYESSRKTHRPIS